FNREFIGLAIKAEASRLSVVYSGNIMLVNIGTHLKTAQYIYLSQAFSFVFGLSDFGIQRSELPINRGLDHKIGYFSAHQLQSVSGTGITALHLSAFLFHG